jgi:Tol biopolymer transport system component
MNTGNPVPSRDGKKLFVQGWQPRGELVHYDAKSGQLAPYLSGISAMGLDFSRDGQWVAYNDASDGTMWRSKADGTQKLQLVFPPMLAYLPRWSPDGKQIVFFGHPPGEPWQIYLIPAEGGSPQLVSRWQVARLWRKFTEQSGVGGLCPRSEDAKRLEASGVGGPVFSSLVPRRTLHSSDYAGFSQAHAL